MSTARATLLSLALIVAAGGSVSEGQPGPVPLRIALLPQWNVNQHRVPMFGFRQRLSTDFRAALDGGVVDHVVFVWQRGRIQRWWLLRKPWRVLAGPEAAALGGRGEFELAAVRPPAGTAAWTEVDVTARSGQPEDVLVLEVGGEISPVTQIVGTVVLAPREGGLRELPLTRAVPAPPETVPVVRAPFGVPVDARFAPLFRGADGVEFLVVRSPVFVFPDSGVTSNGTADLAIETAGEWQEGDRVLIRAPLHSLRSGSPSIALAWKDRITKPEAEGRDDTRPDDR